MKETQESVCNRFGSSIFAPGMNLKVGIALDTLHENPLNAMRIAPSETTNGWYIWAGEYKDRDDFYQPLCAVHLEKYCPQIIKYLALEPGYRVLVDSKGYEDVWHDCTILT